MTIDDLALLGWTGQACFFSRFFVQWWASERQKRSVAPRAFWWLSLAGVSLVGVYALLRGDWLLVPGYVVGSVIYARNLHLGKGGSALRSSYLWVLGLAAATVLLLAGGELKGHLVDSPLWLSIGGLGQAFWVSRFVVQWWASEKAGHSHFPLAFWWISLAGNLLLLAYALHLGDPIYIAGFLPGPFLQARNLMLARRTAGLRTSS
jgi:lipid-A-disaccharide synthase-like uncharacterized protein